MRRGRPRQPRTLGPEVHAELASLARSRTLPHDLVRRAQIVLLCAEGVSNTVVAEQLGVTRPTVGTWRERFRRQRPMGLHDERRPGRPAPSRRNASPGSLVVDNCATHMHAKVKRWLAARPRYHLSFTPAFWLNHVEIGFNIVTQKAIRRDWF